MQDKSNNKVARGEFATRLGVIAATVGSAVGLGNIWGFPYTAHENGGGAFLIVYLVCVFLIGIPVICAEFVLGRGTHKNVLGAFRQLCRYKTLHYIGYISILAAVLIVSFYSVVAGWTFEYTIEAVSGAMTSGSGGDYQEYFHEFSTSAWKPILWIVIFIGVNFFIVSRSIQKGIEKISNIMMPLLFVILFVMVVNSFFLDGFNQGINFMFSCDFSKITPTVVIKAMGQAFFSLSLGLSCLLIYSSYFTDEENLTRTAAIIAVLDTLVAILSGIIIFSALATYKAENVGGPGLVFCVLPDIFGNMPFGYVWASLFFLLLLFASITSSISMLEIPIAFIHEEFKVSRQVAAMIMSVVAIAGAVFCSLSFGPLRDATIFGKTIFDIFNFLAECVFLPLGGIIFSIVVGWVLEKHFVYGQLTNNGTLRTPRFILKTIVFLMRYVSPVLIAMVFLYGLGLFDF